MTIRALTVFQPWASLIALGRKRIETRSWYSYHRGPIAIHAGRGKAGLPILEHEPFASALAGVELPMGAIVAVADLVDVRQVDERYALPGEPELSFGDYSRGRFAWHLANVRPLATPYPINGRLWLWLAELPEEAL